MSKTKAIIGGLTAVLALSAVVVSTASAAEWFVNASKLPTKATLATTAAVMEAGKLKFSSTTIECMGANLNGTNPQIEAPDKGSATALTFTECSTVAGSNCTIIGQPVEIGTVPITALAVTATAPQVEATFKPKTKATFATINFTGASCALSGIQPVTGSAKVTAPTGQTESVRQEIVANTTLGELKVGTAEATLQGKALLQLTGGEKWSFH